MVTRHRSRAGRITTSSHSWRLLRLPGFRKIIRSRQAIPILGPSPASNSGIMIRSTPIAPAVPQKPIAFISGPLEADKDYFNTHYLPRIQEAINKGHRFIIGPSRGVDTLAFDYLKRSSVSTNRVRLYLNNSEETRLRGNFRKFEEVGGMLVIVKGGHTERDAMMTQASHYDILRYRTEEECRALYGEKYRTRVSGTEKNEIRRKSGVGLAWPISQDK